MNTFAPSLLDNDEGATIIKLMMYLNDMEKLAYLSKLHNSGWKEKKDEAYFLEFVSVYTACLIAGHCMECLKIVRHQTNNLVLVDFINNRPGLKAAYNAVLEYEYSGSKADSRSHRQLFANAFEQLRSNMIFHYSENNKAVRSSLTKWIASKPLSPAISFVAAPGSEKPSMHRLAEDVMNQYFESLLFPLYPGRDSKDLPEVIGREIEEMQEVMRLYAYLLVDAYQKSLEGFASIPWDPDGQL